ncbi:unnamed protein product, partial [Owenia fusiformis]
MVSSKISQAIWLAFLIIGVTNADISGKPILINELNAAQPPSETLEYVELYNTSPMDIVMDNYTLIFHNGETGGLPYRTIELDGYCISGLGYFVIGSKSMTNPKANIEFPPPSNNIQNADSTYPDGVGLYYGDTSNTANIVDFIAYSIYASQTDAGPFYPDYLPQNAIAIEDPAYGADDESLNRCNGNAVRDMTQFETRHLSPGTVNLCDGSLSPISVPPMASEKLNNCDVNAECSTGLDGSANCTCK